MTPVYQICLPYFYCTSQLFPKDIPVTAKWVVLIRYNKDEFTYVYDKIDPELDVYCFNTLDKRWFKKDFITGECIKIHRITALIQDIIGMLVYTYEQALEIIKQYIMKKLSIKVDSQSLEHYKHMDLNLMEYIDWFVYNYHHRISSMIIINKQKKGKKLQIKKEINLILKEISILKHRFDFGRTSSIDDSIKPVWLKGDDISKCLTLRSYEYYKLFQLQGMSIHNIGKELNVQILTVHINLLKIADTKCYLDLSRIPEMPGKELVHIIRSIDSMDIKYILKQLGSDYPHLNGLMIRWAKTYQAQFLL